MTSMVSGESPGKILYEIRLHWCLLYRFPLLYPHTLQYHLPDLCYSEPRMAVSSHKPDCVSVAAPDGRLMPSLAPQYLVNTVA